MKVNTQLPLYSIRKVTPITPLSNNVDKREEKKQEEYQMN